MARHSCPSTLSSFMHQHTLTLYDFTRYRNNRICDICNEPVQGLLYQCRPCGFDVHPLCTLLPRHLKHALHPRHYLILNPSANRPCAVCRRVCTRWRYSCNGCGFDIHPGCVLKRSVQAPPNGRGRPQLRRVQMPPQRRVPSAGPPNNNHFNHFTPNLHFKHSTHRPQYYVQNSAGAVVQRPFNNHGGYLATQGGGSTGHRSFGRKMYEIVETLALGVLSSIIFGMMGFDFSAFM